MIQRIGLGLAFSSCVMLAACLGGTTSLGSAQGAKASAGSGAGEQETDGGVEAESSTPEDAGIGLPTSGRKCKETTSPGGYGFGTATPATDACTYLLPSAPSGNDEPNFDPATWDPPNVRVITAPKNIGYYFSAASDCGDYLGWYYNADRSTIVLCPASCSAVAIGGEPDIDVICP